MKDKTIEPAIGEEEEDEDDVYEVCVEIKRTKVVN